MCSDRLNNSMDVAQQRDIDIDRPRPSAQRWPRWQNLRGVFDNESLTTTIGCVSDGEFTGFVRVRQ